MVCVLFRVSLLSILSLFQAMRKKSDMGSGPVLRTLLFMSVPAIMMSISNTLCHLVDTIFVSWLGEAQILAISFTFPVQISIFAVLEGVGNGMTALVARKLGENRLNEARNIALAGMGLAYTVSALWFPLMIPAVSDRFFTALGADGSILRQIWLYNVWVPPTIVAISYSFIANSVFRCQGNTMVPLIYMLITNLTNLVLDPIFIFTFGWGITGAAAATFLSRIAGGAYIIRKLMTDSEIRVPLKPYVKKRMLGVWKRIVRIGLPVTLSTGSVALGMGSVNKILAGTYGQLSVAGWMVGIRVEDIASNTLMGIQNSLVPFLAFNYGRRDLSRMKQGIVSAFKIAAVITGTMGALIFIAPHPLVALFRPSEEIAAMAVQAVRITMIGFPAIIYTFIMNSLFTATGNAAYGFVVQVMRSMVFRISAVTFLAARVSVRHIWFFQPISFFGGAVCSFLFVCVLMRRLRCDMGDDGMGWSVKT